MSTKDNEDIEDSENSDSTYSSSVEIDKKIDENIKSEPDNINFSPLDITKNWNQRFQTTLEKPDSFEKFSALASLAKVKLFTLIIFNNYKGFCSRSRSIWKNYSF